MSTALPHPLHISAFRSPPFGLRSRSEERAQLPLSAGRSAHSHHEPLEPAASSPASQKHCPQETVRPHPIIPPPFPPPNFVIRNSDFVIGPESSLSPKYRHPPPPSEGSWQELPHPLRRPSRSTQTAQRSCIIPLRQTLAIFIRDQPMMPPLRHRQPEQLLQQPVQMRRLQ
jgi:hypothetical protein